MPSYQLLLILYHVTLLHMISILNYNFLTELTFVICFFFCVIEQLACYDEPCFLALSRFFFHVFTYSRVIGQFGETYSANRTINRQNKYIFDFKTVK